MEIGFFGEIRIALDADGAAQWVEQFFGFWRGLTSHEEPLCFRKALKLS